MKNISYRLAENNKEDLKILYELSVEFEKYNQKNSTRKHEHFNGDWPRYFKEEIAASLKDKDTWVYLALLEDQPIGYIYCRICKDCYFFTIEELYVDERCRGDGVGKKLMDLAITKGKESEYPIRTEVFDWNTSAADFYKKYGFELDSYVLKLPEK